MFIGLASMCRRFSCLPGPGGLLEQDGYIMMGVGIAMDAIAEQEDKKEQDRAARMAASARHK